ncbi:MAG TPA: universal stress protein [Thermodesulfobacteriota bacterium]|nr:universal stress protein [Thermodesulfobacteriota bacterium]
MKLTRILAPTDFSKYSGFALEWAAYLAQCMKAELVLLHVLSEEEGKIIEEVIGEGAVVQIPKGIRQDVVKDRQEKLKGQYDMVVPRDIKESLKVAQMTRIGVPFLEIVKVAREEEVDLIVMGTHGRTGLSHVLIGSVAEKVVHHAHCGVLTIKHPQYKFTAP